MSFDVAARDYGPPARIFGTYSKVQKNLCEVGNTRQDGSFDWVNCYEATDSVVVSKIEQGAKVKATLNFANGHGCDFDGQGGWESFSNDRLVAFSPDAPECMLTLFFFDNAVHTVASSQCASLCGSRGSLDGAVLKKRR